MTRNTWGWSMGRGLGYMSGGAGTPFYTFDGTATTIDCGSDATLDNIPSGGIITVEGYIRTTASSGTLVWINKQQHDAVAGWRVRMAGATGTINSAVACATTDAASVISETINDGAWHHLTMIYDDTGDRKIYIAIDGTWATYSTQTAGVDAYAADAAQSLKMGVISNIAAQYWSGDMGWTRVSDNSRYTPGVDFTAPARDAYPTVDGNTVEQWNFDDGSGTTLTASVSSNNNGTITAGSGGWGSD